MKPIRFPVHAAAHGREISTNAFGFAASFPLSSHICCLFTPY
ncbi:hypothetical protein APS_0040 [Acetobacter pasteurianus subsp. pasteurianus LMG 1262 = NBRC 106471]|nr:hypothetical protein APS_0040 [Acetobacter pasteurianus subsp. pasteurianus LMG 1262 = NBRC 106471]